MAHREVFAEGACPSSEPIPIGCLPTRSTAAEIDADGQTTIKGFLPLGAGGPSADRLGGNIRVTCRDFGAKSRTEKQPERPWNKRMELPQDQVHQEKTASPA
jgi:hypothetical protein